MTSHDRGPERREFDQLRAFSLLGWRQQRRERIIAEIRRNRRGDYKVPTWVLGALLAAIVTGWVLLIVLS